VQAAEIADIDARIEAAANALGEAVVFDAIPQVAFAAQSQPAVPKLLAGRRIAIGRDVAFSFLYPANLDLLRALGAELLFFSPLADTNLPDCDAIYLPGGYPELHAARFAANTAMHEALRVHHQADKPLLAECGSMMALFETLTDKQGATHRMAGLLSGCTAMQPRLQALGMQEVDAGHGELRGHSFHYSKLDTALLPRHRATHQNGREGEALYVDGRLTASYLHHYFPSNPSAAAHFFL